MNGNLPISRTLIVSSLMVSMLALSACRDKNAMAQATDSPATAQPASANAAYVPPTAEQLYQMVAPIALFPDKLVALVLAGATYPDQIAVANTWMTQNPTLTGAALTTAADQQAWDPSVKALTAFPAVLSQMAQNIAWTTSLGQAYYNDPADVMNAIQVMRQRAQASGNLSSNRRITVSQAAPSAAYVPVPDAPDVYAGPAIVPPPLEMIVIEPAQPDVVYVPRYDPTLVYGAPMAIYPGYVYPPPVIVPGVGYAGPVSFGVGIAVGAVFGTVAWGWHAWGMHWGGHHDHDGYGGPGGWQRPAVVYNNTTYISRSTTVVNRYNNRISNNVNNNVRIQNNIQNNNAGNRELPHAGPMAPQRPGAMTMPHFTAGDMRPGARPSPPPEAGHPTGMQPPPHMQRPGERMQREQAQHGQMRQESQQREQTQHLLPESRPQFGRPAPADSPQHPPMRHENPVRPPMPQPMQQQPPRQHEQMQREQAPMPRAQSYPQVHPQPMPQPMERPRPQPQPQVHEAPPPHPAPEHREGGHDERRRQQ